MYLCRNKSIIFVKQSLWRIYNAFMQVLLKIIINKNLFNKVMPFCLRFVTKRDFDCEQFEQQATQAELKHCLSCSSFRNNVFCPCLIKHLTCWISKNSLNSLNQTVSNMYYVLSIGYQIRCMKVLVFCNCVICINSQFFFVYKFMYHRYKLSAVYNDYVLSNNLIHDHNTICDQNLHLCTTSTSFGHRSIKFQGCLLWNQLPSYCQDIQSAHCFQSKIRELLCAVSYANT